MFLSLQHCIFPIVWIPAIQTVQSSDSSYSVCSFKILLMWLRQVYFVLGFHLNVVLRPYMLRVTDLIAFPRYSQDNCGAART